MNNKRHKLTNNRKSIRLKGYDYSQTGLYFITLCVQNRANLFGYIGGGKMQCNDAGNMINREWLSIEKRFENIQLHEFIIMPNHFHAVLEIVGLASMVARIEGYCPKKCVSGGVSISN